MVVVLGSKMGWNPLKSPLRQASPNDYKTRRAASAESNFRLEVNRPRLYKIHSTVHRQIVDLNLWTRVGCECPRLMGEQARAVAPLGSDTAGDCARETGRFPGVETADQVRDVAEAGTPQNTGADRASKAAFTMHHQKFPAVQFG